MSHTELLTDIVAAPYAFPGGYPKYAIAADGGCLCAACCATEFSRLRDCDDECPDDNQWLLVALDINWEDTSLYCDNCNGLIESAYGEDEQ